MKRSLALLASLALMVPIFAGAQDAAPVRPGQVAPSVLGFDPANTSPFDELERMRLPRQQNQVRIEQRVVIRVGPTAPSRRSQMLSELPRRTMNARFAEVEHGDCIEASRILGVQPISDNRLLVFTNPNQILAARLEDGCSARAYYAGFMVERSEDGRLCVARDRLQSRAGGSCQVENFTRLVAVAN